MPTPSPRAIAARWRDGGPGTIVATAASAWWQHWPALIAIVLAGALARELFIRGAGFAATIDPLWGMLLLPFIVLSRLAAIVAMLLVVRASMPAYRARLDAAPTVGAAPGKFRDVLAGSVVAFFVIYAAWGLIADDQTEYAASYLEQVNFFDLPEGAALDPFALGLTWLTASVVIVAFVVRFLLKQFANRLPGAAGFVAVYLEAVWVFVAVVVAKAAFEFLPAWLETRRIVVWAVETWTAVLDAVAPLRWAWDAGGWLIAQGVEVIIIPLTWLTLVGIVYAASISSGDEVSTDVRKGARAALARRARDLGGEFIERWKPIADSARTIWSAGPVTMGFIILLIVAVTTASEWTHAGVLRIVAPQEIGFWLAADRALALVAVVIWEPIRICVLAAAFDYCIGVGLARGAEATPSAPAGSGQKAQAQGQGVGNGELELT